jgi:hypothetical protein
LAGGALKRGRLRLTQTSNVTATTPASLPGKSLPAYRKA